MDIAANLNFIVVAVARISRPAIVTIFGGSLNSYALEIPQKETHATIYE
jgi:hypothetical protein